MAQRIAKWKKSKGRFVNIPIWGETKNRLASTAKKRKETMAEYIDGLSKMFNSN